MAESYVSNQSSIGLKTTAHLQSVVEQLIVLYGIVVTLHPVNKTHHLSFSAPDGIQQHTNLCLTPARQFTNHWLSCWPEFSSSAGGAMPDGPDQHEPLTRPPLKPQPMTTAIKHIPNLTTPNNPKKKQYPHKKQASKWATNEAQQWL